MYGISKSQIFVSGIFYGYPDPVRPGPLPPWEPCGAFGPGSPRHSSHHPLPLLSAAPLFQPPTGPPDAISPAQTATWYIFFSQQKSTFSLQSIVYPLFFNEDGRIRERRLSKLHYQFRRYSTLPKTVCLNLNICKVMMIFLTFWPEKIRKTVITLQILRFKKNVELDNAAY